MTPHSSLRAMLARRDHLNAQEEARVAAHHETCAECRERAAEYDAQRAFLRSFQREPSPPALREALVTRITSQQSAPRFVPPRHRRFPVWSAVTRSGHRAGIVILATAALLTALLVPMSMRRGAVPVSAQQLLRAASQAGPALPSSGSARLSYLEGEALTGSLERHLLLMRWWANDARHFRTEIETREPAIDHGTLITVQSGARMTQYDTRTEIAGFTTLQDTSDTFNLPTQFVGVDPAQTVQQYLAMTQQGIPSSVHHFARILRSQRLLGRKTEVVQFAPVYRGIHCLSTSVRHGIPQGNKACNTPDDSGTATIWIDDATHFILKYRVSGSAPAVGLPEDSHFEVTAFHPGRRGNRARLALRLPVPAIPIPRRSSITTGAGSPPGVRVQMPPGFPPAVPPRELHNPRTDMEIVGGPPLLMSVPAGPTSGVDLLFTATHGNHFYPYVPGDRFLLAEERIQVHGLPRGLRNGAPLRAGTCVAWARKPASGFHSLALARGRISVVLTSNALSSRQLVHYAARALCG